MGCEPVSAWIRAWLGHRFRTDAPGLCCSQYSVPPFHAGQRIAACALIVVLSLMSFAATSSADVAKDAAIRGNDFFNKAQYKEAVAAYQLARDGGYATPEVLYNQACAKVEVGELDDAEQLFKQVDADPAAGKLAASVRFNLGSLAYRQAHAMIEKSQQQPAADGAAQPPSPAAVLDMLKRSERGFRGALELDPTDQDAARNVEVVQRAIKQIKDQIEAQRKEQEKQQQQSKDGQNGEKNDQKQNQQGNKDKQDGKQDDKQAGDDSKQDQSQNQDQKQDQKQDKKDEPAEKQKSEQEQLSELAKKQQELAEQSKKTAQDRKDSQQGKPGSSSEQELRDQETKQREQQRDLNKQTQDASKRLSEQKKNPQSPEDQKNLDDAAKQLESAERAQQRAEQALKNHNPDKASEEQQRASELLQQAAGNTAEQEQPPQPQQQEAQQDAQEAKEEKQPKSDMTAAKILDKERREAVQKALRSLRLRGKAAPVQKDW